MDRLLEEQEQPRRRRDIIPPIDKVRENAGGGPQRPFPSFVFSEGAPPTSRAAESYQIDSIHRSFKNLQHLTFGKGIPPVFYSQGLGDPETQFEQIIQKAKEYLSEVQSAIGRCKFSQSINLLDTETQIEKTIVEVNRIALQLQVYIEETSARRSNDSTVNPRVLNTVKSYEGSLNELTQAIKRVRKDMATVMAERERKDLLNEWNPYERSARKSQRDAEEVMSDSTERLMNSKRILLETIQSSSATLGSLATSSQSIQKNEEELHDQGYMVSAARNLLSKYGRRASTDKFLIWLAFVFFAFCVIFVCYRRLF